MEDWLLEPEGGLVPQGERQTRRCAGDIPMAQGEVSCHARCHALQVDEDGGKPGKFVARTQQDGPGHFEKIAHDGLLDARGSDRRRSSAYTPKLLFNSPTPLSVRRGTSVARTPLSVRRGTSVARTPRNSGAPLAS